MKIGGIILLLIVWEWFTQALALTVLNIVVYNIVLVVIFIVVCIFLVVSEDWESESGVSKLRSKLISKQKEVDLKWLHHQYYDLGKNIQTIADEKNVSMMTVQKWLEKLKNTEKGS